MKINLYTNAFLISKNFFELFDCLETAGKKFNIEVIRKTNTIINANTDKLDESVLPYGIFWDKDYYLAKYLEKNNVRLFNSSESIRICDDKGLTHLELMGNVPMPKTFFSPKTFPSFGDLDYSFIDKIVEELKLPVVIKQSFGSFGNEVYLCNTLDEVHEIIKKIGINPFLIQEYIQNSYGRDVRVYVVGGKAIGAILRQSKNDFRANVALGGTATKFDLPSEFKEMAEKAAKKLKLDFCGVDILFGKNGPLLCEVNSNAHFKGFNQATGINAAEYIMKYIKEQTE